MSSLFSRLLQALAIFCLFVATPSSAQNLGVCDGFYPAGFNLPEGKLDPGPTQMLKPLRAQPFAAPDFDTCMVRATDHAADGLNTFARTDYSRRQAFNANNTYFLAYSNDGWWSLYDANTLQHIRRLSPRVADPSTPSQYHLAADAEPQWHATDPNTLYYLPTNGGTKLLALDVRDNSYTIAADFLPALPAWGANARHIWTKSEGSPSADGRYWGFQVEDSDFRLLGYIVWDLQENKLAGSMPSSTRPDHTSMSASGRWFITSSDTLGTLAWSKDFKTKKKLLHKSEHSDLGFGPARQDYYISIDYQSNAGDVFFVDIDACPGVPASNPNPPECPRTVLFPTYLNGAATALHVSGKAMNKPGWAIISTYGSSNSRDGSRPWYTNKIFAIELKANPGVYPLAYTRNAGGSYWAEPHATVSRDFTRILFNSNWVSSGEDIDAYAVIIPPNALGDDVPPHPPCVRANPVATLVLDNATPPQDRSAPQSLTYQLTNKDSASCAASTWTLQATVPTDWTSQLPASLALSPGASATVSLVVDPPATPGAATRTVHVDATNAQHNPVRTSASIPMFKGMIMSRPLPPIPMPVPPAQSSQATVGHGAAATLPSRWRASLPCWWSPAWCARPFSR